MRTAEHNISNDLLAYDPEQTIWFLYAQWSLASVSTDLIDICLCYAFIIRQSYPNKRWKQAKLRDVLTCRYSLSLDSRFSHSKHKWVRCNCKVPCATPAGSSAECRHLRPISLSTSSGWWASNTRQCHLLLVNINLKAISKSLSALL